MKQPASGSAGDTPQSLPEGDVRLHDRDQIVGLLYAYASAVDTSDWNLFRSLFTDQIELDFSSVNNQRPGSVPLDAWVGYLASLRSALVATQHFITNPQVCVSMDRASCTAYVRGEHVVGSRARRSLYTIGARYMNGFARLPQGWRMYRMTVAQLWDDGDRQGMEAARAAASAAATELASSWRPLHEPSPPD